MSETDPSRVKTIFADAIDLDPAAREAFVDSACGDDTQLKQRVLRLLRHHDDAAPEFGHSQIGPYKLIDLIGEGGFGSVYLAEQQRPVRRQVALKVVKLGMDTKQVIARFDLERQALAMMDHPNIARVFDAGATDTGRPYFAMELVDGVPITDYCQRNQLGTANRLRLFMSVCSAVQHAHQKGIIHRDIKPTNVLITQHDGQPVAKVIDFGIAKATDRRIAEQTIFTEQAQIIGTPQYMSPEQAELRGGADIDTRADIYSLGVLLYELLTGTTPFDPKRLRSAAYQEILRIIREEEPPRPSTRLAPVQDRRADATKLARDLRGDLDWVVMRAIEKDRARRYDAASDLAADIERYLQHRAVEARPPTLRYRAGKFIRRNRVALSTGAAVVGAIVIGLIALGYGLIEARRGRDAAVRAQSIATAEKERAEQVARFLSEMLAYVGPMRAQGRDTTILREILDQTRQRVGAELKDQPEVHAEILLVIGRTYRDLAMMTQAEEVIRESLQLRQRALGNEHQATIASLGEFANLLLDQGKVSEAEPIVDQVVAGRRALFGADDISVAQALNDLSYVYEQQARFDEAIAVQRQVVNIVRKHLTGDHADLAASLNRMAKILNAAERYDESDPFINEALEIRRRLYGDDHSEVALSLEQVAFSLQRRGELVEAEQVLRRVLDIRTRVYGPTHAEVANSLNNLGWMLIQQGKHEQAEPVIRNAMELWRETAGPDHPNSLTASSNLGNLLHRLGRLDESEALLRDTLERRRLTLGAGHPDTHETAKHLAAVYDAGSQPEQAARVLASTQPASQPARE